MSKSMPQPSLPTTDRIVFAGVPFRRYPESDRRELRVYWTSQRGYRLHQAIWEYHNGPIPPGHHVHHRDGDPLNNDIANLECLPGSDHIVSHWTDEKRDEQRRRLLEISATSGKAWRDSEAGRAWYREHGKRIAKLSWEKRRPETRSCEQCGADFACVTKRPDDRFCSNACKSALRRASGVDDENRECPVCGRAYRCNRYRSARTCSRVCGQRLRRGPERTGLQPDRPRDA